MAKFPFSQDLSTAKDKSGATELQQHARRTALSHLPRIIASLSALWQAVLATKDKYILFVFFNQICTKIIIILF